MQAIYGILNFLTRIFGTLNGISNLPTWNFGTLTGISKLSLGRLCLKWVTEFVMKIAKGGNVNNRGPVVPLQLYCSLLIFAITSAISIKTFPLRFFFGDCEVKVVLKIRNRYKHAAVKLIQENCQFTSL